uniref:Uncharacterized protein n=1 Tax=Plectus sambesii TaxID=2011161 RepID=A0A914WZG9_9BILA
MLSENGFSRDGRAAQRAVMGWSGRTRSRVMDISLWGWNCWPPRALGRLRNYLNGAAAEDAVDRDGFRSQMRRNDGMICIIAERRLQGGWMRQ